MRGAGERESVSLVKVRDKQPIWPQNGTWHLISAGYNLSLESTGHINFASLVEFGIDSDCWTRPEPSQTTPIV